jgi:hypothetical protein
MTCYSLLLLLVLKPCLVCAAVSCRSFAGEALERERFQGHVAQSELVLHLYFGRAILSTGDLSARKKGHVHTCHATEVEIKHSLAYHIHLHWPGPLVATTKSSAFLNF